MKNYLVSAAISLVIVLAGLAFYHPTPVVQQTDNQPQPYGAVSTLNNVESPLVGINGFKTYYVTTSIAATSSVLCSAKNPFNATSTLAMVTAIVTNAPFGTAVTADVSTSSTAFGSSTPAFVYGHTIANAPGSFIVFPSNATSSLLTTWGAISGNDGSQGWILSPSNTVTVRVATSTAGTLATNPTGTCHFVFESLQ